MTQTRRTARRESSRRPSGRLSLRAYLGLAVAVPLVALVVLGALTIDDAWNRRQVAREVEALAVEVGVVVEAESALGRELSLSYASAIIDELDLELGADDQTRGVEDGTLLAAARRQSDRLIADLHRRDLLPSDAILADVRALVDDGAQSVVAATGGFADAQAPLRERSEAQQAQLDGLSRTNNLSPTLEARRRVLGESLVVLESASRRISALFSLASSEAVRVDLLEEIVEAGALQRSASTRGRAEVGPRARSALDALDRSGASRDLEALYEDFVDAAVLDGAVLQVDPVVIVNVLVDGLAYANAITDIAVAAAADLQDVASDHAADAARTAATYLACVLLVTAGAAAIVVVVGRAVARPAEILETGARHISEGEFRLLAVPPTGPRELGAAVEAFNEMTETLTALEDVATSMADEAHDPAAPATPLPGRTGAAMQAAVDRLRTAMAESARQRAELHALATEDGLTGLLNRRAVLDELDREIARARRQGSAVMALYIDLDGLKTLNDTYGHKAGDTAIEVAGQALHATTRDVDIAARIGGDEFLVIGSVAPGDEGRRQAERAAERILEAIATARPHLEHDVVVPLNASVGVAVSSGPALAAADAQEQLIKAADDALYVAKRDGRARIAWADA